MVFQFEDFVSFLAMAGHGSYVWSCYIITFAAIAGIAITPMLARRRFIRQQKSILRREAP